MTTFQKVIKYVAIAFAIFIIFAVINTIINVGRGITGSFIREESTKYNTKELDSLSSYLDIKLSASNLEIKKGEKLKVETNSEDVKISENDNKIIIEEKAKRWYFNSKLSSVILYVPEDLKFDDVRIETGAGKLSITSLETDSLKLMLGAGKTTINKIVSNNAKIETGAGEFIIKDGKLNDAKIEVGVGRLEIKAEITGDSKIESGVGSIKLSLLGEDYKIVFNKGIGSINFNGKSVKDDTTIGDGINTIKINGGVGSINVKTEKDLEDF